MTYQLTILDRSIVANFFKNNLLLDKCIYVSCIYTNNK